MHPGQGRSPPPCAVVILTCRRSLPLRGSRGGEPPRCDRKGRPSETGGCRSREQSGNGSARTSRRAVNPMNVFSLRGEECRTWRERWLNSLGLRDLSRKRRSVPRAYGSTLQRRATKLAVRLRETRRTRRCCVVMRPKPTTERPPSSRTRLRSTVIENTAAVYRRKIARVSRMASRRG